MKTININQISTTKGLTLNLDPSLDWLHNILKNVVINHDFDPKSISGELNFVRTNKNVDISGTLIFTHFPFCAHCGKKLTINENISIIAHLSPFIKEKERKRSALEEVQLTKEDLDFCFYEKDLIELEPLLNDEIGLALEYNYYCKNKEDCKIDQPNQKHITINDTTDPRWAPLQNLKVKL